ncbi:MAG: hypothetical protein ACLFPF_07770, partial [Halanaerobiales bacterium]
MKKNNIKVLITGATGNVGEEVIKLLCSRYYTDNITLVLAARDIEKTRNSLVDDYALNITQLEKNNYIEYRKFDFTREKTYQ